MTRLADLHERSNRTAPARAFSGGYVGHGQIMPMGWRAPVEMPRVSLWGRVWGRMGRG